MLNANEENINIGNHIQSGKPLSVIRLRSETNTLYYHLNKNYPNSYPDFLENNGGLYPLNKNVIEYYNKTIVEGLENVIILFIGIYIRNSMKIFKSFGILI